MKPNVKKIIQRLEKPAFILLGALVLTSILMNLEFNLLEANLYDFRMTRGSSPNPSSDIVLVTIDDSTLKALNEFSPLPLNIHVQFLEKLAAFQPRAVGYVVEMNRVEEINPDLYKGSWGHRFVSVARQMEKNGTPLLLGTPFDVTGEVIPPYPLSGLSHSIAVIHKDGNLFSEDKITRRALTYLYEKPTFHSRLAQILGNLSPNAVPRGSFFVPEVDGHFFFFRYHGSTVLNPNPPNDFPYRRISFIDILEKDRLPKNFLLGKIVLVGTLTKEDSNDFIFTPYSKKSFTNPKLVVHANILDSIIKNNGITRAPGWINWVITFLLTAFVVTWVMISKPLYGVFMTLALIFVFLGLGHFLFQLKGIWLRESQPLVGIFVSYYLVVPYRLILEYKKRWDLQKKNEILLQVEELKTNFLSLVTHDLKTPVARIQGLAEVLQRKASERLIERDKETVQNIIASTEELNRFINSILELNRVESNPIELHLESKDLNQIIEKSVEGFRAQSRAAQIKIKTNLDPLFPVKVDSSLMTKVLNNLIDNAIKYSYPGSEIQIESKESKNWIEINVKDQGIGLAPQEVENIFTRFYRAKNETTAKTAGTGLGLYLSRYFVEAHRGSVKVESVKNQGSTFKILLPLQGEKNDQSVSS